MTNNYLSLRLHELLSFVHGLALNKELVEQMSGDYVYSDLLSLQEILAALVKARLDEEMRVEKANLKRLETSNE